MPPVCRENPAVAVAQGAEDPELEALHRLSLWNQESCPPELIRELERRAADAPPVNSLPPTPSTDDIVTHAIRRSVAIHIDNAPGVVLGDDPEHLHRARVAIRRLRSDLRTFEPLLDSSWSRCLRSDLRRLARVTGTVRDTDVLIDRFDDCASRLPSRAGVDMLIASLVAVRTARQRELTAYMESSEYVTLLDRLFKAAREPALDPAGPTSADTLSRLVRRPWRRLTKTVNRLPDDPPDEMLHAVRIRTKRVRYAAEAVTPALGKPARRFAKSAKRLQVVLGTLHDAAVAHEWLTSWSAGHHAPQAVFVAGQLDGLEIVRGTAARGAWRNAWRDLNRPKNTEWIT
jgi:CHAD domain-containing protein